MNFHDYIKEKRLQREVSLREFCRDADLDASNWSKIERGIADVPKSKETLEKIAEVLKLSKDESQTLKDLAMIESIPKELRPEKDIFEKLPIFFQDCKGEKPTEEELRALIKALSNS